MELKINEQELYQSKVKLFQEDINSVCEKHGLFLLPNISYSQETGIIPVISIIPKQEVKETK